MCWFRSSDYSDPAVGATVSARNDRGVRPFPAVSAALVAAALAAPGPVRGAPITVLVAAPVGDGAQQTMPAALWLRLVSEYVGTAKIVIDVESTMPDEERCRAAHAGYALFATFDRAPRLPGTAQDTDRAYAVARFTLRNCATGAVSPTKVFRLESDPVAESDRGGNEATAERQWVRAVHVTLTREPLKLAKPSAPPIAAPVWRVTRVRDGIVFLDGAGTFTVSQVLVDYANADGQPHVPVQLVVTEVERKYVTATVLGRGTPRAGDLVTGALPTAPPSPTPSPTPASMPLPTPTPSASPVPSSSAAPLR